MNLPSLLDRYKAYLVRMKAKGLNPFKDQPRRTDLHYYTEAVGHFHLYLYAWLQAAIGRRCVASPKFPTDNSKVDIHIRCNGKKGIIEVKSFAKKRAQLVQQVLVAKYPEIKKKTEIIGMGYAENIVGSGTDDARDAIDRRVEFRLMECTK